MPKRVERSTIEQWRDGECIRKINVTDATVERSDDGACRVVFPPGGLTLASGDELHFDIDGLIERLTEVRSCPKKR
jgi:hypothetical protein